MAKIADATNPALLLEGFKAADTNGYDSKKLSHSITAIRTSGMKLDARVHATAVALLERAAEVFDCSLVGALVDAMPKSARRKALIAWFGAFSNVAIRFDKGENCHKASIIKPTAKGYQAPRPAEAFANPFWSVEEKDVDPKAFDFGKRVAALLKAATGAIDSMSDADKSALADLKLLAAKLEPTA